MTKKYFLEHVDAIHVSYPSWCGVSPAMGDALLSMRSMYAGDQPPPEIFARAYCTPIRAGVKRTTVRGREVQAGVRRLISVASGDRLDILELRSLEGQFIGRAHVLHDDGAMAKIILELWIDPNWRRQGFGTALEQEAGAMVAGGSPLRRLIMPLHEADASPLGADRARQFARARGYSWLGIEQRLPPYVDFAEKRVR